MATMTVVGVDIGGSGIKGAPVNLRTGALTADRYRIPTPQPSTPEAVVTTVAEVIERFTECDILGVTFPGVIVDGVVRTAVNMSEGWIGCNLAELVAAKTGRTAYALNDADAAGLAEVAHGAAKRVPGVVIVLTFGTGVGSGVFLDGKLVPNTELGHLELDGRDAERLVSEGARERKKLSWKKWAKQVNEYLAELEELFSPALLVVGGGIAKQPDDFMPLLKTTAPLRVAALANQAGIVGAAMAAQRSRARR
jgi:polyphosphate glucokinase